MHHITGCAAEAQMRTTGLAKGAECRESTLPSVSGEKHSLDIPFYRTRPNRWLVERQKQSQKQNRSTNG